MKAFLKIIGVLILLGALMFGYIFYSGYSRGPEISDRVTEFLELASDYETEAAYEFFTKDLQNAVPFDGFSEGVDDHFTRVSFVSQKQDGFYFSIKIPHSQWYNIFKIARFYEYQGTITYSNGQEGEVKMTFIREDGQWKMIAFYIGDPYTVY